MSLLVFVLGICAAIPVTPPTGTGQAIENTIIHAAEGTSQRGNWIGKIFGTSRKAPSVQPAGASIAAPQNLQPAVAEVHQGHSFQPSTYRMNRQEVAARAPSLPSSERPSSLLHDQVTSAMAISKNLAGDVRFMQKLGISEQDMNLITPEKLAELKGGLTSYEISKFPYLGFDAEKINAMPLYKLKSRIDADRIYDSGIYDSGELLLSSSKTFEERQFLRSINIKGEGAELISPQKLAELKDGLSYEQLFFFKYLGLDAEAINRMPISEIKSRLDNKFINGPFKSTSKTISDLEFLEKIGIQTEDMKFISPQTLTELREALSDREAIKFRVMKKATNMLLDELMSPLKNDLPLRSGDVRYLRNLGVPVEDLNAISPERLSELKRELSAFQWWGFRNMGFDVDTINHMPIYQLKAKIKDSLKGRIIKNEEKQAFQKALKEDTEFQRGLALRIRRSIAGGWEGENVLTQDKSLMRELAVLKKLDIPITAEGEELLNNYERIRQLFNLIKDIRKD